MKYTLTMGQPGGMLSGLKHTTLPLCYIQVKYNFLMGKNLKSLFPFRLCWNPVETGSDVKHYPVVLHRFVKEAQSSGSQLIHCHPLSHLEVKGDEEKATNRRH